LKKILFYIPFIKVGGIEKVSISYLNGLIESGYKVDLIIDFNMGKRGNAFEHMLPKKLNYKYIKNESVSKFIYYFRTLGKTNKIFNLPLYFLILLFDFYYYHLKVKKILQIEKYDYTMSAYQFLPSYLTKYKTAKHFIWLHGSVEHYFTGLPKLFTSTYKNKLTKYDQVITTAFEMKEQLEIFFPSLDKDKISMIYNPVDFNKVIEQSNDFQDLSEWEKDLIDCFFICTVCRLDENQKDMVSLIEAYEALYINQKIDCPLYVIGSGPSEEYLKNIVLKKGLKEKIIFLGYKNNPYIWIKKAKLFILSTKFEGLPTILIETMILDTFIISSNCKTGPKEILNNGNAGDLFSIGDVNELSVLIEKALKKPSETNQKISNAKIRTNIFNNKTSIKQLVELMRDS